METVFFVLACCLSLSVVEPTADKLSLRNKPTLTGPGILHTGGTTTSINSVFESTMTTLTSDTTILTSATEDNTLSISPSATVTNSRQTETLESTATMPLTNSTSTTNTTVTQTTALTTSENHTDHYTSASHTTATVASSVSVVQTTSQSEHSSQGPRLSISERNLTITFGLMLSVFVLAVVGITIQRCSHKVQYLHQPLNNTNDMNAFTAEPDALIISGGLYDGHPIYDSVPPTTQDESQFRLEFLH